ncbi:MAG TPA: hypothetical protein VGI96_31110 [Streptosporangiaceae bacterium]|jgi:hypothetical protein
MGRPVSSAGPADIGADDVRRGQQPLPVLLRRGSIEDDTASVLAAGTIEVCW